MRDRGHPTLAPHDRTRLNNRLGVKSVTTPDLRPASPREYQECLSVYREACRFVPNPFEAWRFSAGVQREVCSNRFAEPRQARDLLTKNYSRDCAQRFQ